MYREEPQHVTIVIRSLERAQEADGTEEIREEKIYEGVRYEKGEKTYLKYEDVQEGVTIINVVVISPEEIIIRRTGGMDSRLQFRNKLRYSFLYHTLYGDVPLCIETKRYLTVMEPECVRVHLTYDILSQDAVVSYHEIQLEAKTK